MTSMLTALVLLGSPALAAEPTGPIRRYALVVGANDGGADRVTLRYAQSDAQAFLDVLTDLGGVAPRDAVVLREPDERALDEAFEDLANKVGGAGNARTELIFYYSGHSDEQGLLLRGERYSYGEVRRELDAIDADVRIAVVDSCASGALIRAKGGTVAPPFLVDESRVVKGHAYLTSASADESAQEADRLLGSYFTHSLVTGLRGAADATGDGRVTLSEAYAFAYDDTLSRTEGTRFGPQHANHDIHLSGTGDLVLTDLSAVDAGVVLEPGLSGRLSIRDGQGRLVAEVFKPAGRPMELGLGAGRYRLRLERDDGVYEAKVWLATDQRKQIELGMFESVELVATVSRGDPGAAADDLRYEPVHGAIVPLKLKTPSPVRAGLSLSLVADHVGALKGSAWSFGGTAVDGDAVGPMFGMGANVVGGSARGTHIAMGGNGVRGDHTGLQVSMGANVAGRDVKGAQITMGANVAGRDVKGTQISMGTNLAGERFRGFQGTMGLNLAGRDVVGAQVAVGGNGAVGAVEGAQISVGANVAGGPLRGAQISGAVNIAAPSSRGFQGSAGVNIAGNDFHGVQLGLVNIGADQSGTQVGVVNVARDAGSQIGLLNVARSQRGVSLGLLQVVKEGQLHGEAWASDTLPVNAGLQFGSKSMFTELHVGMAPGSGTLFTGAGLGLHLQRRADPDLEDDRDGRLWGEVDLVAGPTWRGGRYDDGQYLGFLRGSVGLELGRHFSPEVGVHVGTLWTDGSRPSDLRALAFPDGPADGARFVVWPGVFAGAQF